MSDIKLTMKVSRTKKIRLVLFNKGTNTPEILTGNTFNMIASKDLAEETILGTMAIGDCGLYFAPDVLTVEAGVWTFIITRSSGGELDTPISGTITVS